MPIRLLALDLDGTLLNSRGQVSERNRKALEQARERGVRVAIVTGRRFRDARPKLARSLVLLRTLVLLTATLCGGFSVWAHSRP